MTDRSFEIIIDWWFPKCWVAIQQKLSRTFTDYLPACMTGCVFIFCSYLENGTNLIWIRYVWYQLESGPMPAPPFWGGEEVQDPHGGRWLSLFPQVRPSSVCSSFAERYIDWTFIVFSVSTSHESIRGHPRLEERPCLHVTHDGWVWLSVLYELPPERREYKLRQLNRDSHHELPG